MGLQIAYQLRQFLLAVRCEGSLRVARAVEQAFTLPAPHVEPPPQAGARAIVNTNNRMRRIEIST